MSDLPPDEPGADIPDLDLGKLAADDALLDALGRGQLPAGAEPIAAILAAYRADLDDRAVAADDALLDALGHGHLPAGSDPIATILAAYRAELDEQARGLSASGVSPLPVVRRRWTGRVAAVAVVGGVLLSGTGVAAALTAQPGDLLYGVRRVVVGPVDDSYRKNADALVDQTAKLSAGSRPISRDQQARLLDTAADLVPGIKDPGRKKALVNKIASARAALGLPSQPIVTDGPPLATPGPEAEVAAPAPSALATPTASPSPTPDGTSSPAPSAAGSGEPSGSPSASGSTAAGSGSPSPSATPSHRRRHRPSPSPSPSASASYSYVPPPPPPSKPKPSPTPSPTFIIG
ncbi:MAG TPA: hypothetical protein VHE83_17300 [Mycobacteriales bacterium]|nr:hypothetical protein [Mycobacteriales bacterium]